MTYEAIRQTLRSRHVKINLKGDPAAENPVFILLRAANSALITAAI